jgi:nucleoside-diphosphate-sugar epimerase
VSRVLVTGATGLLGRSVARLLVERGAEVTVSQRGRAGLPAGDVREVRGDIADPEVAAAAVAGQDGVVHLAAKVDVTGPRSAYERTNVTGTEVLLAAARRAGVARFVYVSSPAVAHDGRALVGVGAEPADPTRARGNYARSKARAERLALAAASSAMAVTAVRPHLVWGPGDTQLIARVVERARAGRLALVGSGAALIDTTYIDNAADAIVAAYDRAATLSGLALVVSNGEPRPIAEIVLAVCRAAGLAPTLRHLPFPLAWTAGATVEAVSPALRRAGWLRGDPPITRFLAEQLGTAHWFEQTRTRQLLDWAPRVDLDAGFARLAAWYDDGAAPTAH